MQEEGAFPLGKSWTQLTQSTNSQCKRESTLPKTRSTNSTLYSIVLKLAEIKGNAMLLGPKTKQACGAKHRNLESLLTWFK
ncbi:hypothetical protein HPB50_001838 [Hyalomma asiaticum]|uniref:Uncharacterized protein n=1 Tax=Hyalomma asiaticum TaxID=266040 RepID=A0ACB7SLI5_HYAAI|nr:hypothetical protein HPB50_001838 [Hyalomma asiaticum]